MKVIEVTRYGGPDVLQVVEKPRPEPGPGQVLIEVKAAGINFADTASRAGTYPMASAPPFVPGFEAAGVVAALGPGVQGLSVGTRVMANTAGAGGYAEFVLVEAAHAVPLPDGLDFAPATALLVQGLTAYFLLNRAADLAPGRSVLVGAAAGGVGSLAVQLAKKFGAGTVVGLASTPAKRELVQSLGADAAVDYTQPDWPDQVKAATQGRGADVFLDATGDTKAGLKALAPGGTWVIYGSLQGKIDGLSGEQLGGILFGGQTLRGFSLYNVFPDGEAIGAALREMIGWAVDGSLKIEAGDRFPLVEAARAHAAIEARRTTGKVVLEP